MSKAVKKVGKAFKKVAKAAWKIVKPVAIAVAAYFTAGVALSFIPATAGFAASLPGFAGGGIAGLGVGAGATAGTGAFTSVATTMGLGGGLASGAVQGSAMMSAITGVSPQLVSGVVGGEIGTAGMMTAAHQAAGSGAAGAAAGGAGGAGGAVAAKTALSGGSAATKAGMSLSDKILLAKVGTDVVGAAFGPTELDMLEAKAEYDREARQGTYYGMDPDGNAVDMPNFQLFQTPGQQQPSPGTSPASPPTQQEMVTNNQPPSGGLGPLPSPGSPSPSGAPQQPGQGAGEDQTRIQQGRQKAGQLFETSVAQQMPFEEEEDTGMPGLFGKGQMKQQYDVPEGIFAPAPGVRYV